MFGEKSCRVCGTVTTEYNLSDVPEEKIQEQRKRYNEYKKEHNSFISFLNVLSSPTRSPISGLFDEDWDSKYEIIETDAGQKAIDDEEFRIRNNKMIELREKQRLLEEEYKKFKHLGRNDRCACGSGKKYKQCCINKFKDL